MSDNDPGAAALVASGAAPESASVACSALTEAHALIYGERAAQYGTATQNFEDTARLWSVVLGIEVNAYQVLLCLAQLKIARAVCNLRAGEVPKHDTVVDIAGYAGLIEKLERGQ